jgi:hypothetical protein
MEIFATLVGQAKVETGLTMADVLTRQSAAVYGEDKLVKALDACNTRGQVGEARDHMSLWYLVVSPWWAMGLWCEAKPGLRASNRTLFRGTSNVKRAVVCSRCCRC